MRTFLKIALISLPILASSPSLAQFHWGVDIRLGTPPPPRREIVLPCPYPGGIWEPGYYDHYGRRYIWVPGRWRRPVYVAPPRHHCGWKREWYRGRDERREWRKGEDHDHDDYRHGRIR